MIYENPDDQMASNSYAIVRQESINIGRFCITFEKAHTITDVNGLNCDNEIRFRECDTHIHLYIDGRRVFKTRVITGDYPNFDASHCIQSMKKDASITIELWDWDPRRNDDLIFSFNTNVSELLEKNYYADFRGINYLYTKSSWVPKVPK